MIFTIPRIKIKTAGKIRIISLSTFNRKLTTPVKRGSQNSKNLKSSVIAIESALVNPERVRTITIETSIAPSPRRNGDIIRNITTTIYAMMAVETDGVKFKAIIDM